MDNNAFFYILKIGLALWAAYDWAVSRTFWLAALDLKTLKWELAQDAPKSVNDS